MSNGEKNIWKRNFHKSFWFWLLPILFCISLLIIVFHNNFFNFISFLGLFSITLGSVFALRPGIRKILNEAHKNLTGKIISKSKEIESNENSTIFAFFYIMQGFVLLLFNSLLDFFFIIENWVWLVLIELILLFFTYIIFKKNLKLL